MTPKRPTLPEGTDPLKALRQLQEQLAEARYMPLGKTTYPLETRAADQGGRDAERAAGMNLLPIVTAVEELVADLRRRLAEADPFGPDASDVTWYGSLWMCPVAECKWTHREENAVSSTDTEAAERVVGALADHLVDHRKVTLVEALAVRMLDWPAHCSEWIAGADPESPDQCPEYASPGSDKCALHDPRQVEYAAELMARQGWLSPSQAAELRATAHRLRVERFADSGFPVPSLSGYVHPAEALNLLYLGSPDATPQCPGFEGDGNPFTLPQRCARCGYPASYHPEILQAVRGPIAYPEPTLSTDAPEAKPRARVASPPVGTEWRYGFPPREATTMWRCQRCSTNHEGNPPACLHCGHTVLDPGHWQVVRADLLTTCGRCGHALTEATGTPSGRGSGYVCRDLTACLHRRTAGADARDYIRTGQIHLTDCPGYVPHCGEGDEKCNRCRHCGWTEGRHANVQALRDCRGFTSSGAVCVVDYCTTCGYVEGAHPAKASG